MVDITIKNVVPMAGMNFSIAVKLVSDGVQSGANQIKASLRSIQFQALAMAGALAGGVGSLSDLLRTLIDTARETSRVQTALKNVSTDTKAYASSLKYLKELSETYGLELNGTASAFTKFTAAATASGLAMSEQEKIFSAVSRSISAFGLSGSEATLTFYAISQMMAKGKISAEELRRQLGERMPIAMEAMARAAKKMGYKENLDDLLKAGKLRSKDILPQFAEELNSLVVNVDTDNAETSVNRLRNSFIALTEDWDIAGKFKRVVDAVRDMIEGLRESMAGVFGVIGGAIGGKLFNGFKGQFARFSTLLKTEAEALAHEVERTKLDQAKYTERADARGAKHNELVHSEGVRIAELKRKEEALVTIEIEKQRAIEARRAQLISTMNANRLAYERQINATHGRKRKDYDAYVQSVPVGDRVKSYEAWVESRRRMEVRLKGELEKLERQHAKNLQDIQVELDKHQVESEARRKKSAETIAKVEQASGERIKRSAEGVALAQDKAKTATNAHTEAIRRQGATAVQASQTAGTAGVSMMTKLRTAGATLGAMFRSVGVAIKGMLASFAPTLIIGGIIAIITKLREMREAWEDAKNAVTNYQKEIAKAEKSDNRILELDDLLNTLGSRESSERRINGAMERGNALLGERKKLTRAEMLDRLAALREYEKAKIKLDAIKEQKYNAIKKNDEEDLERKSKGLYVFSNKQAENAYKEHEERDTRHKWTDDFQSGLDILVGVPLKWSGAIKETNTERDEAARAKHARNRIIAQAGLDEKLAEEDYEKKKARAKSLGINVESKVDVPTTPEPEDEGKKKKKTIEEHYFEELRGLTNQLRNGSISQAEYDKALNELKKSTHLAISARDGERAKGNKVYQATADYEREPSEEAKLQEEFTKSQAKLQTKLDERLITEEEYKESMRQLIKATIERTHELTNPSEEIKQFRQGIKSQIDEGGSYAVELPKREERDASRDYKKSESQINKEKLDLVRRYIAELEQLKKAEPYLEGIDEELKRLQAEEVDLSRTLRISEVRGDVQKLQKEINKGLYGSFKELAQAVRSLHSGIKGMMDALSNPDASGFEQVLAVVEGLMSSVDTILQLKQAFDSLSEGKEKLKLASEALALTEGEASAQSIASMEQEMAVGASQVAQEGANATASKGILVGDALVKRTIAQGNIAANTAEGASSAAKGALALPFPANILAVGGAVAAALAIFKSLPKFANGGIVPGNSRSGDRVLAGVNSGELILNEAQQHNIASKLVSRGEAVEVKVNIKERLRGKDLRRSVERSTRSSKR